MLCCFVYLESLLYIHTCTRWDEELIDLAQTWTPKENSKLFHHGTLRAMQSIDKYRTHKVYAQKSQS